MSIVRMKKLTLLCVGHDRGRTLEKLRDLGVLHVRPMVVPTGRTLDEARGRVAALSALLERLPKGGGGRGEGAWGGTAEEIAEGLLGEVRAQKERASRLETLSAEAARLGPYGDFNPADIVALGEKGVTVRLYHVAGAKVPRIPEGVAGLLLSKGKAGTYWALYAKGAVSWEGAEEVKLPKRSLSAVREEMGALEREQARAEERIAAGAGWRRELEGVLRRAEGERALQEVTAGMGATEKLAYVQGFLPEGRVEEVRAAAAGHGWGLMVEDPGAGDDVPVALRQPRWAKPIQAVFDGINILPGYQETDISVVFMVFFSLFFAMIIGDAGYGALFLGLTLWFRKRMAKDMYHLLVVTSVATMAWGLVSGSVFGIGHDILRGAGFDRVWIRFLTDEGRSAQNVMGMCFLIGAIQITIGHLWNVFDLAREGEWKALEQLGWTLTTWYMFFLADSMIIGGNMVAYIGSPGVLVPFTGSALDWVGLAGIVLILLFMMKPREIKENWFNLALFPLNLISNFTDVVSYVRLYAVGAAGFAVANAFNTMIFGGKVTLWSGLIGAVLVFFAHALNILLCVMGVLVHGIRLNTLEFSNHKGISWSGTPYRPFRRPEPAP